MEQLEADGYLAGLQVKLDEDDASPLREITQLCT